MVRRKSNHLFITSDPKQPFILIKIIFLHSSNNIMVDFIKEIMVVKQTLTAENMT